jgi:hypothetical protein
MFGTSGDARTTPVERGFKTQRVLACRQQCTARHEVNKIARVMASSNVSGSCWCKDPVRVVLSGSFGLPVESDGAKRESIETPRRRQARSLAAESAKRVGGVWVKARTRLSPECPEREKPKGAASSRLS